MSLPDKPTRRCRWIVAMAAGLLCLAISFAGVFLYRRFGRGDVSLILRWLNDPAIRPELVTDLAAPCPGAPFRQPSPGLIGLLWNDPRGPYTFLNPHSGVDIFGDGPPGSVPVVAAYHGYLTRLPEWKSAVIIRHDDPLEPGRTIWIFYTHMADIGGERSFIHPAFPPGTSELFVGQGTLLGWQGEYNGGLDARPIGMHVHFSIVQSDDEGWFRNETYLGNTLDPSPYLGMTLNAAENPTFPVRCAGAALG